MVDFFPEAQIYVAFADFFTQPTALTAALDPHVSSQPTLNRSLRKYGSNSL